MVKPRPFVVSTFGSANLGTSLAEELLRVVAKP